MVCKNCLKDDNDLFEYKCNVFKDKHNLMLFLLNIVLNIQKIWEEYCVCDGEYICLVCQVNTIYKEYEYVIFQNCLNLDFLAKVRENICGNLNRLLTLKSHFVCHIIYNKYQYQYKDWFTGDVR